MEVSQFERGQTTAAVTVLSSLAAVLIVLGALPVGPHGCPISRRQWLGSAQRWGRMYGCESRCCDRAHWARARAGDNFDFLTRNRLFTLHLIYVFPNGASGFDTSFQALATAFAAPDGFGAIPLEVRQTLQGFADRMQPALPVLDPLRDGGASDYSTMCWHYCGTLFETGVYSCVARTGDAATCAQLTPSADQCYELRCVPGLVPESLCLTQCDSLRAAYESVCADGSGPAELCATSAEARVRTCHDSC